ncbi:inositol 1,4,5-trisphosphate receptor-interacting protein [Salminus brasiliensis]|uniref:inositol 1,4,5-trisphosphate receptor-interacting protein n=1 Tax=Salminus brasiliensis TaxID=930266 RepID=UPI003B831324
MEEMLLHVCVLLVSLVFVKDPTIFEEEDEMVMDMQAWEHLLQKEDAKLGQEVQAVAVEQLQASGLHDRLAKGEGEELDVQQIHLKGRVVENPQEQQKQPMEGQSTLHHESLTQQAPNVDNQDSPLDRNLSDQEVPSGGNDIVSQEDAVSVHKKEVLNDDREALNEVQASSSPLNEVTQNSQTHLNHQVETTDKLKSSEEGNGIPQEHQTSFFQQTVNGLIQRWFQASQDMRTSDKESLERSKQQQMQLTQKREEMAQRDERISEVHQGHSLTSNEPLHADLSSSSQVQTEALQREHSGPENAYIWYLWKVLSLLSVIRLLRKFLGKNSKSSKTMIPIMEGKKLSGSVNISAQMALLDNKVLGCFYERCVQTPLSTRELVCDFVEGFVDEILQAARNAGNKGTDLQIGNSVGVGSLYELWATGKTMVCDLYVPLTAPRSYSFDFELDMPGCGRIKLVKAESTSNGCPCANGMADDDMLCLLHPHNETNKIMDAVGGPLCQGNTPYLAKTQVVRWFRRTITKAWEENSHKYEFDLAFRNRAAPGALRVRLRSGQAIFFNITPVVQVQGSEVFLVSHLPSDQGNFADTHWPVSLASYEKALLKHFNQRLPNDSCHVHCLQILSFLHKQQNILTGKCGLGSYHLKITLLHLLLASNPADWKSEQLACRLTDMLMFLAQRLQECKFHHALVTNPLVPSAFELPKVVQLVKPTNLFQPLLSDRNLYLRTVEHLQELVKNAPVLIQEYVSMNCSGASVNLRHK